MNMVEKVARAIKAELTNELAKLPEEHSWLDDRIARAAIEALRDPSDGMIKAGQHNPSDGSWSSRKSTIERHHAVIDEALKE